MKWQKEICQELGLTGRILLAHEGINGTVAGQTEQIERYKQLMNEHPLFGDIDFKESYGDASYFPKMSIKVKPEIVHLGVDPEKVTVKDTGKHLTPDEAHAFIANKDKNVIILDTRNDYESRIGTFQGALIPDIKSFRELPEYLEKNSATFKDKKVLMFCTGGVRCERATAVLNQKNLAKEVYQVEGGIVRYTEAYPDGFFRGKNYVFDRRVAVRINDDVLSNCDLCDKPCDDYTNCVNALCNLHYISCNDCAISYNNTCSTQCKERIASEDVPKRAPFIPAACNAPAHNEQ